jgi:hypothetical protein
MSEPITGRVQSPAKRGATCERHADCHYEQGNPKTYCKAMPKAWRMPWDDAHSPPCEPYTPAEGLHLNPSLDMQ